MFDHIIPFGTVGYMQRSKPKRKLAPRGVKCIMIGIDTDYPRRTFRVRDLTTGQVTMRQAIIWHPTADAGEAVSSNTATNGGGRDMGITRRDPRSPPTTRLHLGSRETVSEEPESEQHGPGRAGGPEGAFALERVEHETGEFLGRRGQRRRS